MESTEIMRRLVERAYEMGWRDACDDHMAQDKDPQYPIGRSKRHEVSAVVGALDPNDLLGLLA